MLRLVIIFIFGIITIPHIQNVLGQPDTISSTDVPETTLTDVSETTFSDASKTNLTDTSKINFLDSTQTDPFHLSETTLTSTSQINFSDSTQTDPLDLPETTLTSTSKINFSDSTQTDPFDLPETTLTSTSQINFSDSTQTGSSDTEQTNVTAPTDMSNSSTSFITATFVTNESTTALSDATVLTDATILSATTNLIDNTSPTYSSAAIQSSSETSSDTTNTIPVHTYQQTITTSIIFESTISVTTQEPITPRYKCDFNEPCHGNLALTITNGTEFNPPYLSQSTKPPIAPTSDVSSIDKLTNNNELCQIPYQLPLDNSTEYVSWNMFFCYKNQCKTKNGQQATCTSDSYGLNSIILSNTTKTYIDALSIDVNSRDSLEQKCLRYYYYFTVYDEQDWGQKIRIWMRPNNQIENQTLLKHLTFTEMPDNSWQYQELTINSSGSSYSVIFSFEVDVDNETDGNETGKTVYFALDNIELYDYNCSYVNGLTTTLPPSSTTIGPPQPTTTTSGNEATPTPSPGSNLGTIIGLSLGIGIPVLLVVIGGIFLYKKKDRNTQADHYDIPLTSRGGRPDDDIFRNPYLF